MCFVSMYLAFGELGRLTLTLPLCKIFYSTQLCSQSKATFYSYTSFIRLQ